MKIFSPFTIFDQLAFALKTEFPLKIFTILNIFFTIQDFLTTCVCPEKQSFPGIFHCMEYTFYIKNFWATCACPEKTELSWKFSLCWIYFLHSGLLQLALALKHRRCPEFKVLNIHFLPFRIFEQFALALKNRVALEFFTVWNILITLRIFEQLALALKNTVTLEFFTVLNMYFLSFRIFEQLALSLKNRVALKVFTVLNTVPWQGSPVPPARGEPRPFVGAPQYILY